MKRVALINGSPSGKKASSLVILKELESRIVEKNAEIFYVPVRLKRDGSNPIEVFEKLCTADSIILSFPLYAYTIPASLGKFLEDFIFYLKNNPRKSEHLKMYAFVNCGFFHPSTNDEAIRVIKNFCRRAGIQFRFGTQLGGGLVVVMMRTVPLINRKLMKAFRRVVKDIFRADSKPLADIKISPFIPKRVMDFMKDHPWSKRYMARREAKKKQKEEKK